MAKVNFNLRVRISTLAGLFIFILICVSLCAAGQEDLSLAVEGGSDVIDAQMGWDFSSPEASLIQDDSVTTAAVETPALAFPFSQDPNIASDAGVVGPFGMGVIPDLTQEALQDRQEGGEGQSADITRTNANIAAISALNKGLEGLSGQEKQAYITENAAKYAEKGALAILAGQGKGHIITDAEAFNQQFPEKAAYFRGNINRPEQKPDYVGKEDDILMTMMLSRENSTGIYLENLGDALVKEMMVVPKDKGKEFADGTAMRVAKAGAREVYLTAEHCLFPARGNNPVEIYFGGFPLVTSDSVEEKYQPQYFKDLEDIREQKGKESSLPQKIIANTSIDTALFFMDKPGQKAKVGDTLEIISLAENDPKKGENLFLYLRPDWLNVGEIIKGAGYIKTSPFVSKYQVTNLELPDYKRAEGLQGLAKDNFYGINRGLCSGFSGSPIFQKDEKKDFYIGGVLSFGDSRKESYFVKPSLIRKFINAKRSPSLQEE